MTQIRNERHGALRIGEQVKDYPICLALWMALAQGRAAYAVLKNAGMTPA